MGDAHDESERGVLRVSLPREALDQIEDEVAREEDRTGDEHTPEEFARHAIYDQLARLEADRLGRTEVADG